jgi:hypothetical protein
LDEEIMRKVEINKNRSYKKENEINIKIQK